MVGIGLNLTISPDEFPPDLRDKAVSIFSSDEGGRGGTRRSLPAVRAGGSPHDPL